MRAQRFLLVPLLVLVAGSAAAQARYPTSRAAPVSDTLFGQVLVRTRRLPTRGPGSPPRTRSATA